MFHIVARGSCWVAAGDGDRHWAQPGDVIVIPYGDDHTIGGKTPAERVSLRTLLEPPPWDQLPLRPPRWRRRSHRSRVRLPPLRRSVVRSRAARVPPAFVVRVPDGPAAGWIKASVDYALEATEHPDDASPISTRLPELVLIEVLRLHLATAPAAEQGWVAALHDPVLAPALALLHRAPERKWTVADLAVGRGRVAVVARRTVPRRARSFPDPLSDRVADASRRGPARHDRHHRVRARTPRRLRLGGVVQPRVQTCPRPVTQSLARRRPEPRRRRVTIPA